MPKTNNKHNGYVCFPYLHNHQSIEVKDLWFNSKNINSMFFVTATFSDYSKPYFPSPTNHYILAKFKGVEETNQEILSHNHENFSFVFNTKDVIFNRHVGNNTNFISIYYLEYAESDDDLVDIAIHAARRDKIGNSGFGSMQVFSSKTPKFTFPYSNQIITFEIFSGNSHQSDNKYCDQTRRDICRKGIVMNNLVTFSVLEILK